MARKKKKKILNLNQQSFFFEDYLTTNQNLKRTKNNY